MTFRAGQKVVCVDADGIDDRQWVDCDIPVVGAVYTVVRVFIDPDPLSDDLLSVELLEIKNNKAWQYGYSARRFRPAVEDRRRASFTAGAPQDSERWDNRKKQSERV